MGKKQASVVKLSIVVDRADLNEVGYRRGVEIASRVFDAVDSMANAAWEDPHGGRFTKDEQDMLQRIAEGVSRSLTLHVGTPDIVNLHCRLVARFI